MKGYVAAKCSVSRVVQKCVRLIFAMLRLHNTQTYWCRFFIWIRLRFCLLRLHFFFLAAAYYAYIFSFWLTYFFILYRSIFSCWYKKYIHADDVSNMKYIYRQKQIEVIFLTILGIYEKLLVIWSNKYTI